MRTMIVFASADSRAPHEQQAAQRHEHDGWEVEYAAFARRREYGVRHAKAEHIGEQRVEILRPPTDTAAEETYSRSKHAATPKATISPIVA